MVGTVVPESIKTFVDLLSYRASIQPDVLAFRFLSYSATGIEADTITFKALDSRARQIAKQLLIKCQPGDRALMLYPSGIDFIAAYFGCLYAGVIAVPGYPPKRNQKLGRLKSLVQNCQAKVAMTDLQTQLIAEPQFDEVDELKSLAWVITDTAGFNSAEDVGLPQVQADDIAFLQYTSGSTGDPKGVMVTHANLMANSRSIYTAMEHGPDTVFVGWLPLFHDMGLIGNVLQPIYAGIPSTLMAPASFLQRPMRWLEAISKYKATTSGGPNFSYDLCVDSIKDEDLVQLDLRSWTIAFNGAEPIRPETLRTFSDKFSRCGFDPASHYACYGMAETTLLITGAEPGKGTRTTHFDENQLQQKRAVMVDGNTAPGHELVSCGNARCEQGVVIVNPDTMLRCAEGEVGEVWAHGDSNAKGYWQRQDATATTFAAYISDTKEGPYLRTGDLGFVHQGELYIAGRLKDVVIIRGMNHYPQDIELTAFESHEAFMPNGAAVFTVEEKGQEQLVIVLEIRRTYLRTFDPEALARAIQQAVVLQHELQVRSIVFIKPGQLPKTSSGKVQRQRCKQQFLDHQIEAIGRIDKSGDISVEDVKRFDKDAWQALPDSKRAAAIEDYIAALFEAYAKLSAGSIQRDVAFIGYGLDSLTLTQIAARISDELDINLQVQNLFEVETVHKLSVALNAKLLDPANKRQRITPIAKHGDRYPLSFAQQRMWFMMQYEASALYNIHGVLRIEGDLNVNALDLSFQEIMRRHDALRTRFVLEQTEPVQIIDQLLGWKLSVVDMSDRTQVEVDQAIDHELNFVFDLSEDILFRATVYKQPDGAHSLVVCMHHIISDGWSISVLMQELSSLYGAYTNEQASPLQPLPIQYPDYAIWQRAYLTGDVLQRQENYWKSQLKGVTPIALPTDKARPATPTYAGHSIPVQLDVELTQQLKSLSKEQGVTLYMTLLTAFGVLLHKYSGQDDICIGTPIANRTMTETKNLMGFFVNTIAMRADYGNDPLFRDALHHTKALTVDAYAHQDLPFEKVVDLVQTERDISTSPLFQVMFVLQDVDPGSLSLPGLQVQKTATVSATSKFDITLELFETAEGLCGNFEYKTDLFDASTIERLSSHFKRLLAQIIQSPNANISKLSLLDDSERQALLSYGNAKTNDAFAPVCSHLLFEAQAEKNPTAIALQFNQHTMTYGELNRRANQLAHYLVVHGVKPDTLVGLCIDRSFEMVVALLGIMKAGGAYVAFDPTYPAERLKYLLEDSGVKLVVTQSALADVLPINGQQPVFIDNSWLFDPFSSENLPVIQIGLTPESLAYVIYTSGSTGNPKASLLMHKG
ncbi:MAG: condensation domain-containing protein, partial [Burkholderiaceae bacterium]